MIIVLSLAIFWPFSDRAKASEAMAGRLAGRILIDVERQGQAWYVDPSDQRRYFLGRPDDAFAIMRQRGLGIAEVDFQRLAQADMPVKGDPVLAARLAGRILIRVEQYGEAWYLNPVDQRRYFLGRPADAFAIMRRLGLGIKAADLALVHKAGIAESIDAYSHYDIVKREVEGRVMTADIVTIDLSDPRLRVETIAADPHPTPELSKTSGRFGAAPLADFIIGSGAFAGINGSYFCSGSGCGAANYYFYPIYSAGTLINESELKYWTTGPIMAITDDNHFHYFKDSREFPYSGWKAGKEKAATAFRERYGRELTALIGNKPRLIENKENFLIDWELDQGQKTTKTSRQALAYRENVSRFGQGEILLVSLRNATVPDLASYLQALEVDHAVNLDGGYSSALWYNDEYMVGPGRNIPNAIIFRKYDPLVR